MDLGEEALLQLNDCGVDKDWSTGYNDNDNYCQITKIQNKMKESIVDSSKMITIQYEKYNPTNMKFKFQNDYIQSYTSALYIS